MKRVFDVVASSALIVLTSPIVALAAAAVVLGSRGPAFHRGTRVGRDGRRFEMIKLRTMQVGAESHGPAITAQGDPRINAVGRVLRRTKIDEIPQLINVVRGEMSLVGPRPEAPEFVAHYTPDQRKVLSVRPGVTGPAALAFIDEEELLPEGDTAEHYLRAVMPRKLELDLEYVRTATFGGDLRILGQTAVAVLSRLLRRRAR